MMFDMLGTRFKKLRVISLSDPEHSCEDEDIED